MVDLKTLFKEINSTKKNKEPRLEILIIQLYVEHFLNEIITLKSGNMPEQIIKENLSIPIKTKIIETWGIINNDHKKIIDSLAKTRNDLIHNLIIDFEKIEKRLKSVNFDFIRDKKGKRIKIFAKLKPYYRLTFSSIFILGLLYYKSMELKRETILQSLKLEIVKKNKEWEPKITLIETEGQH